MKSNFEIKNVKFFLINLIGIVVLISLVFIMQSYLFIGDDIHPSRFEFRFDFNIILLFAFLFFLVLVSGFMNYTLDSSLFESLLPLGLILCLLIIGLPILTDFNLKGFVLVMFILLILYFAYLVGSVFVIGKVKWYKYLSLGFTLLASLPFFRIGDHYFIGYLLLFLIILVAEGISVLALFTHKENEQKVFLIMTTVNMVMITLSPFMAFMGVS